MNIYPVIDMHCDTIPKMYDSMKAGKAYGLDHTDRQISLDQLKKGNYMCQCFSLFTYLKKLEEEGISPFDHVSALAAFWKQEIGKYPDQIRQVFTYKDIEENASKGIISAIMTAEEGAVYEGKIENLRYMHEMGVRISTITWNFANELGFPNPQKKADEKWLPDMTNGLTARGFEFIEEMERLGILVDVSHLNDAGIRDIFTINKKPVIASHSNAREVHYHLRNLSDENIRKIAESGGVIGINFFPDFLKSQPDYMDWDQHKATALDMVEHMKYIRNIGGIDCIALGTDFDGYDGINEIKDASYMPKLAETMLSNGFTSSETEKIFSKNILRVFKEVW